MNSLFQDKVCLVTGGGSGVGRAAAKKFAQEGAIVIIANRRIEKGKEVLAEIIENGYRAHFITTDISKEEQVQAMIDEIISQYGKLDCAFNCAGFEGKKQRLVDFVESDWDAIMDTNLKGTFFLLKHEIKVMLKKETKGTIVNMSSVSGYLGRDKRCAYNASRAGINSLTKTAAMEYIKEGIRINAIAPAAIKTDIFERMTGGNDDMKTKYANIHPIGRIATPDEIAEAALWLCSDKSSFVVGQTIIIDGGIMVNTN